MYFKRFKVIYHNIKQKKRAKQRSLLITITAFSGIIIGIPKFALAHCPLCTAGVGIAALGAAWLGVSTIVIGVFVGAFAIAAGLWFGRIIEKRFFKNSSPQRTKIIKAGVVIVSYLTTIIPLTPLFKDYSAIYISLGGDYGSILNRTYLIDRFIIGSIVGGVLVCVSPTISNSIKQFRNGKLFPYQGVLITFALLLLASVIIELVA